MKIVHVPFTFAPDPIGGTEIYVESLARSLRSCDIESIIVAPSLNGANEAYEHKGLRVRRFSWAKQSERMLRELYGEGDPKAAAAFAQILDEERPDAVHVHAFTRAVSVLLIRAAKRRGMRVIFTYHTPTVSCQRGTLMLWGKEVCDGTLSISRCTSCSLESQGLPRVAAVLLGQSPVFLGRLLEKRNLRGGMWTALRMPELMRARHKSFTTLMREVDVVVALRDWVREILVRNGVPASKIVLSPHGLTGTRDRREAVIDATKGPLRVVFFGRANAVKGVDTLIKAVRALPTLKIELDLYGVIQSAADEEYWATLKRLASADSRIVFLAPVDHRQIITLLGRYHLLAVPSRCLETGPLVILESFAAGTPVVGSRLGGIAELVQHRKNGLLLNADDVKGWTNAFRQCAEDREFLASLRGGIKQPRTMANVAQEMLQLYKSSMTPSVGPGLDRLFDS